MIKRILLLLFPIALYAQTVQYPDTVVTNQGRKFPCKIIKFNSDGLQLYYGSQQLLSSAGLQGLARVSLGRLGNIYKSGPGQIVTSAKIDSLLDGRKKAEQDKRQTAALLEQELEAVAAEEEAPDEMEVAINPFTPLKSEPTAQNSFSVFYVPLFLRKSYQIEQSGYSIEDTYIGETFNSDAQIAGTYSRHITNKLYLTVELGYNATLLTREEKKYRDYEGQSPDSKSGYKLTDNLHIVNLSCGIKYYFKELHPRKVSPYLTAVLGKQFAFASRKASNLFEDDIEPSVVIKDNSEKVTEDLNSPWLAGLGFGTEYQINKSLALYGQIAVQYTRVNTTYKYRQISETTTYSGSQLYKVSDFGTRIGIGFNFYF